MPELPDILCGPCYDEICDWMGCSLPFLCRCEGPHPKEEEKMPETTNHEIVKEVTERCRKEMATQEHSRLCASRMVVLGKSVQMCDCSASSLGVGFVVYTTLEVLAEGGFLEVDPLYLVPPEEVT